MMTHREYAELATVILDRIKELRDTITEKDITYKARIEECSHLLLVISKKFSEMLDKELT